MASITIPSLVGVNCKINIRNWDRTNTWGLYEYIEKYTKDIIENIIKLNINGINPRGYSERNPFNYYILGGKAINRIVRTELLVQSFDTDIHIFDEGATAGTLLQFNEYVCNNINNFLLRFSTFAYRLFLYNILLQHNLILPTYINHYLTSQLFYFGNRAKISDSRILIPGVFIHLKINPGIITVDRNIDISNRPVNSRIPFTYDCIDLFYPVMDTALDQLLSYDNVFMLTTHIVESVGRLKYANFIYTLFNLIHYIAQGGTKQPSNINKLAMLINPSSHVCGFNLNPSTSVGSLMASLNELFQHVPYQEALSKKIGIIQNNPVITIFDGRNILDPQFTYYAAIQAIIININYYRTQPELQRITIEHCTNDTVIDDTVNTVNISKTPIFIEPMQSNLDEYNRMIGFIETTAAKYDEARLVLTYTTNAHSIITQYLQFTNFNCQTSVLPYSTIPYLIRHDGILSGVYTIEPIPDTNRFIQQNTIGPYCDIVSRSIRNFRDSPEMLRIEPFLSEYIYLYRLTTFFSYMSDKTTEIFNPSVLNEKYLMYVPHFQSTSFSSSYEFGGFLTETSLLLKIRVSKNFRRCMFLNKYSMYKEQHEALIDKDVFYVGDHYSTRPIRYKGIVYDIRTFDVTCFDNYENAANYINERTAREVAAAAAADPDRMDGGNSSIKQNNGTGMSNDAIYCINMSSKPEMIAKIRKIIGDKQKVIDYGGLYEVPRDQLGQLDDPEKFIKIYGDYSNIIFKSIKNTDKTVITKQRTSVINSKYIQDYISKHALQQEKQINPYRNIPKILEKELPLIAASAAGGSNDPYYHKYLKYKQKYLEIKKYKNK